jgi:hypothetical protein
MEPIYNKNLSQNSPEKPEKRCKIRVLCHALNLLDDHAAWTSSAVLMKTLSAESRKYLTLCTMLSNEPDELVELTEVALRKLTIGMPLPPFSSPMNDARWWTERASPNEIEAYAATCFLALSKPRQIDFANYVVRMSNDG